MQESHETLYDFDPGAGLIQTAIRVRPPNRSCNVCIVFDAPGVFTERFLVMKSCGMPVAYQEYAVLCHGYFQTPIELVVFHGSSV